MVVPQPSLQPPFVPDAWASLCFLNVIQLFPDLRTFVHAEPCQKHSPCPVLCCHTHTQRGQG